MRITGKHLLQDLIICHTSRFGPFWQNGNYSVEDCERPFIDITGVSASLCNRITLGHREVGDWEEGGATGK